MKRYTLLLLTLAGLLGSSCTRNFSLDDEDFQPHIVLHCFVCADSAIHVELSRSWLIGSDPADFDPQAIGLSFYINEELTDTAHAVAHEGDRIRLVASASGLPTAEATTEVPRHVAIRQAVVRSDSIGSRAITRFRITFQDPPAERNYYGLKIVESQKEPLDYPSYNNQEIRLQWANDSIFSNLQQNLFDDLLFPNEGRGSYLDIFSDERIDGERYTLQPFAQCH